MAQFTLPNIASGGSITVNAPDLASAQAAAANQTGVSVAQQQAGGTFGANTGGGVGMGGGPTPSTAIPGYSGDLAGLQQFAAATSGVTDKQLAQQKSEFDAQLAFAQQQMQQLGIPQLQINQFLANLQQQQFQSQLTLAQQAQEYNQAATTASLTGWFTPPSAVPSVQQWTGGGGLPGTPGALPGAGGTTTAAAGTPQITAPGSMTWDQLSNMMRSAAGSNYNDAAKQLAFSMRASGGQQWPNSGSMPLNLSPAQMNQIIALGTGNQFGSYGALTGQTPAAPAAAPTAAAAPPTTAAPAAPATPAQPQMTEAQREFLANLGLAQGQLGQQYLSTAAQLQGPQ